MMRAGGLEAEAEDDHDDARNPAPAIGAGAANAVHARAEALANAGQPLRGAQMFLSKKHIEVVIGANGDEWVKHGVSRNRAKQYWRCRDHHVCSVRGWSNFGDAVIHRMDPAARHNHNHSPAMQAVLHITFILLLMRCF